MTDEVRVVTVQLLLERLEHLIRSAPPLPLGGGRSVLRTEEALELIDRIRRAFPQELQQASDLLSRRDAMLAESQAEAERIVLKAEEYASQLVRESEVLRLAQQESEQLRQRARREASELEAGANAYADSVLEMLEQALANTVAEVQRHLQQIQAGREELRRRLEAQAEAASASDAGGAGEDAGVARASPSSTA